MAVLRSPQWPQVLASDWTLAEFSCAVHAKELRGQVTAQVAQTVRQTLDDLITKNALQKTAVVRDDYVFVQRKAPQTPSLVRGADALHLAVAARVGVTHFASLDKTQRLAATSWLAGVKCIPLMD